MAKVLNLLLVKAEVNHQLEKMGIKPADYELESAAAELGKTPAEVAKDAGLAEAVIAGERPKVRDDPLAALYGGGGGGGGPSGDCATINRL